jgi:lysophospholipase L1-like esterase
MTLRKLAWILAPALLAALLYWWINRPPVPINLPPTATGPWIAFGDSLTEGYGATEGNAYPALLSRSLGVPIVNLGVSGDTTTDGLKRLDAVARQQPRVVLLCLGGNDALSQMPQASTLSNLEAIIDRLHAEGSFVVLIGIRSASFRDRNEKAFARLAREKRVLYVPDFLKGLAFKPVYMSDAIHPNDEGYKRFSERLEKVLRPLLPQLTGDATAR